MKRDISDKFDSKSDKYLFLGYPKETIRYYLYHPLELKVFILRHATFLEKELGSESKINLEEVQNGQIDNKQLIEVEQATHDDEM